MVCQVKSRKHFHCLVKWSARVGCQCLGFSWDNSTSLNTNTKRIWFVGTNQEFFIAFINKVIASQSCEFMRIITFIII